MDVSLCVTCRGASKADCSIMWRWRRKQKRLLSIRFTAVLNSFTSRTIQNCWLNVECCKTKQIAIIAFVCCHNSVVSDNTKSVPNRTAQQNQTEKGCYKICDPNPFSSIQNSKSYFFRWIRHSSVCVFRFDVAIECVEQNICEIAFWVSGSISTVTSVGASVRNSREKKRKKRIQAFQLCFHCKKRALNRVPNSKQINN